MESERRRPSGHSPVDESYDAHDYALELAKVPKSRAPSYVSTTKSSIWNGEEDDEQSLIGHARISSGYDGFVGKDIERAGRRDTLLSTTSTNRTKKKHWLAGNRYGWHFGVSFAAGIAITVLLLNIALTIYAATSFGTDGGIGTAFEGSCEVVNNWTTWLHIVINVLSSLLLSASNYTMQALSAPTRREVDIAHAKGDWMDIGVPSVRNLFRIRWHRRVVWVILAISSIPIHLLYNSALFKTIASNQYIAVVASPKWFDGGNFSITFPLANAPNSNYSMYGANHTWYGGSDELVYVQKLFMQDRSDQTIFQNMTNTECINTYSATFVSGYNNVVLVTSDDAGAAANQTVFWADQSYGGTSGPDNDWMCMTGYYAQNSYSSKCSTVDLKKNPDQWKINGKTIDYCLAQIEPQRCTLQFSLQILIAVIICNALKSASMLYALYKQKDVTLVTVGDAITSYLDTPDELTKGRCLMSRRDIATWRLQGNVDKPNTRPLPRTFFHTPKRLWSAASGGRWAVTLILVLFAIVTSGILLDLGVESLRGYGVSPFALGFGAIDGRSILPTGSRSSGAGGLLSAVLLANLPQTIVSFIYMLYNSLATCLMLTREWSTYSQRRKPLRVTTPHGVQRSTYYLQLPFRYSAPLLVISATLHWLISQSIFLARINVYVNGTPSSDSNISQVGYSCAPILTAILLGVTLLGGAIVMGFKKVRGQMPIAGSCSVAIAAACHPPKDDVDAAFLPVRWGEIQQGLGVKSEEIGHCSFTSFAVDKIKPGRMYAGTSHTTARHANMSAPSRRIRPVV